MKQSSKKNGSHAGACTLPSGVAPAELSEVESTSAGLIVGPVVILAKTLNDIPTSGRPLQNDRLK